MGFSSEAIIIKPAIEEGNFTSFLNQLGIDEPQFNKKAFFEEADSSHRSGIYIGNFEGSTFLIYDNLTTSERGDDLFSGLERQLTALLPTHELLTLLNIESSNAYLYHYIKDGKSVRLKSGDYTGVHINEGDELFLEKAYYAKKELDDDGEEIFYTSSTKNPNKFEAWTHDQIGGSVAFNLTELLVGCSYTEVPLDCYLHQYLPKRELAKYQHIPAPRAIDGSRYFHRKVIKHEFLPVLEEEIVPFFQAKGFQYKPTEFKLFREINGIHQYLQFTREPQTELLFDINITFEVNASALLKGWSKARYGKETFGNGNEIDNRQPILKYEHQLPTIDYKEEDKVIDTTTFGHILKDYVKKHILSYFEIFAGYKAFADYAYYKCFRADFYYMMGESERALRVLAELYESIHDKENRNKYLDDIKVRLAYELPDTPVDELLKMVIKDDHSSALDWSSPEKNIDTPPPNKKNKNWWNKLIE